MDSVVERLTSVDGVIAVVVGGSRARGTHAETSDHDLGLYYRGSFDVAELQKHFDVTGVGGWGPWINGGGWLGGIDVIYRDLDRVERVIDDCTRGRIEVAYQPGHPLAFTSAIYMGEVAICRPLWDPQNVIAALKQRTNPYPPALREAIERTFAWEAGFCVEIAEKALPREDAAYIAGCCFRGVMCVLQVVLARCGEYWMNEKGAAQIADRHVPGIRARIESVFAAKPADAVRLLRELVSSSVG